jgi:hypothetical protein
MSEPQNQTASTSVGSSTITDAIKAQAEARAKCKTDLLYLAEALGYDFQPDVHTELFANFLQKDPTKELSEQDTKYKDRLILWPRGHFKTSSTVVEVIQLILCFPDIRILLMQGTVKNTKNLLKEIKRHFTGEAYGSKLIELFPEFCAEKLGTADAFTVPARVKKQLKEATITVASPKSVKAGQHFDAAFFDDLIHEQNFRNSELVQKAIDDFNHYSPLIDPGGYRYVTGTRYTFGDLYEWIIQQNAGSDTWKISVRQCWTVNEDGSKILLFPRRTLPSGQSKGFTLAELESKQTADPVTFSAQYLNLPIATSKQLFTEELLFSHVRLPGACPEIEHQPTVLFVDLAAGKDKEADDSVIIAGKSDSLGRMYVIGVHGDNWTVTQLAHQVIHAAVTYRPLKIMVEGTASAEYFIEYVKLEARLLGLNLPLDKIKVSNVKDAKDMRISTLEGLLKQDRLFFFAGLQKWDVIVEQFTKFPRTKHDDYPDTIALMTQFFSKENPYRIPVAIHPVFNRREAIDIAPQPLVETDSCGGFFCS